MKYSEAKKQAIETVETARAKLLKKLKRGKAFKALEKELSGLDESDRSAMLTMDEEGMLCLEKEVTLSIKQVKAVKLVRLCDIGAETKGYYSHDSRMAIAPEQVKAAKAFAAKHARANKYKVTRG